jgi:hypothetical protein
MRSVLVVFGLGHAGGIVVVPATVLGVPFPLPLVWVA